MVYGARGNVVVKARSQKVSGSRPGEVNFLKANGHHKNFRAILSNVQGQVYQ
jgi:hypothetical protein